MGVHVTIMFVLQGMEMEPRGATSDRTSSRCSRYRCQRSQNERYSDYGSGYSHEVSPFLVFRGLSMPMIIGQGAKHFGSWAIRL